MSFGITLTTTNDDKQDKHSDTVVTDLAQYENINTDQKNPDIVGNVNQPEDGL